MDCPSGQHPTRRSTQNPSPPKPNHPARSSPCQVYSVTVQPSLRPKPSPMARNLYVRWGDPIHGQAFFLPARAGRHLWRELSEFGAGHFFGEGYRVLSTISSISTLFHSNSDTSRVFLQRISLWQYKSPTGFPLRYSSDLWLNTPFIGLLIPLSTRSNPNALLNSALSPISEN